MSQTTLAPAASTQAEMEMELTDDELEAVVGGLRIPLQIQLPQPAAAAAA